MSVFSETNPNLSASPRDSHVPEPEPVKREESIESVDPEDVAGETSLDASRPTWKPNLFAPEFLRNQFVKFKINPTVDRVVEISIARHQLMSLCNEHYTHIDIRKQLSEILRRNKTDVSFLYMYRSLERTIDPSAFLDQVKQHVRAGFIEMTSPLMECVHGTPNATFRGNPLNFHIVWADKGVLHILPKHPIYPMLGIRPEFEGETRNMLIERPHYQTTFYTWDEEHPLQYEFHTMDSLDDLNAYNTYFQRAVEETMVSSNQFFSMMLERLNAKHSKTNDDAE